MALTRVGWREPGPVGTAKYAASGEARMSRGPPVRERAQVGVLSAEQVRLCARHSAGSLWSWTSGSVPQACATLGDPRIPQVRNCLASAYPRVLLDDLGARLLAATSSLKPPGDHSCNAPLGVVIHEPVRYLPYEPLVGTEPPVGFQVLLLDFQPDIDEDAHEYLLQLTWSKPLSVVAGKKHDAPAARALGNRLPEVSTHVPEPGSPRRGMREMPPA